MDDSVESEMFYKLKGVDFMGSENRRAIVLQNENGPCPLIAVANVLLLRGSITLRKGTTDVSRTELLTLVTTRLLEANEKAQGLGDEYQRNVERNVEDAINLLPKLATGLDVNVRFRNITDFEFTQECATFDLLDIPLVHGWLVSPEDASAEAIGNKSYNELITKVFSCVPSGNSELPSSPSPRNDPEPSVAPVQETFELDLISFDVDEGNDTAAADEDEEHNRLLQQALALSLEKCEDGPIERPSSLSAQEAATLRALDQEAVTVQALDESAATSQAFGTSGPDAEAEGVDSGPEGVDSGPKGVDS
eukprot:CAMPEP_0198205118 /NCGR_PEP_ID=MMETSP1445-20131203/8592_1 /TAXON_ID=36898 /ORGANISM="Pyramimonas sp., Strain CCMP2087" /LENGTH=306 /DNA_ID=CAMNT_0043877275 /DNA_START=105 /DNA_END=1022 /DNA_ORIENTATION=+